MAANEELNRILQILATTASIPDSTSGNYLYYHSHAIAPPPPPPPPPPPAPFDHRQPRPSLPLNGSSTPIVDPRSIVEWPAAVRYVTRTLAQDEAAVAAIKKMKSSQHDHEKAWFAAREDIIKKHSARKDSGMRVQELLRKLGTLPNSECEITQPTPESEAEELATFDRKVYLRSEEMHNHMKSQMSQMGVPFFCRPAEAPELPEMAELRRRMVELLEDMCED